jgi:hypothetical protein
MDMIFFDNAVGYVRDLLLKPMSFVIYAVLVGAPCGAASSRALRDAAHHSRVGDGGPHHRAS